MTLAFGRTLNTNTFFLNCPCLFQARRISLEDAGKLFKFYRECDEFETWMKEKVRNSTIDSEIFARFFFRE